MVVNRKQPTAPQPVSRSASTQHVPTKRTVPTKGTSKLNGSTAIDSRPSKSTSQKPTKAKAKKRRPETFLDHLFFISLSLFTFYSFYACRPNPIFSTPLHNEVVDPNPLCRSLHGYRVHILEPYVLPCVKHTFAFTHNIAEPYIAATHRKVDPYVAPIVKAANTIKPHVSRAVNTSKAIWNDTLVPFYKGTLLRYYCIAILPRYRLYIKPRLLPLVARASKAYEYYVSRPLHIQATRVNKILHSKLHPYVARVQPYINQAYTTVYQITVRTITIHNTHIHPRLVAAWTFARPHLHTALKVTKSASLKTAEIAATQAKYATREASAYRRTYVDPHVRKIWDKVAEGTPSASIQDSVPTSITTSVHADDLPDATTAESVIEPTSASAAEALEPTPVSATPEVDVEEPQVANPSSPSPEEPVEQEVPTESKAPIPPAVDAYDAPIVASSEPEVEELVSAPSPETIPEPIPAESVSASEAPMPSASDASTSAAVSESQKSVVSVQAASLAGSTGGGTPEVDLDEFLASIGVEEQPKISGVPETTTVTPSAAPTPAISAEEAERLEEERLAAIAVRRGKLVDRHEKWFADLAELIANETDAIIDSLTELRETKVAELAKMAAGSGAGTGIIDEVQVAGERLLKGLEGYVRKAETRSAAWKFPPGNPADVPKTERETKNALAKAEKEKWGTVVEKVEAKFADTVQALRATVHAWFMDERAKELDLVASSAQRVKDLAQAAQGDIGLAYAWLEDVSYADWQSYHELMNMFQAYEDLAHTLQNGTELPEPAPLPPVDTIVPALDKLHNELQDVILGFNVALGPIRSVATRVFSVRSSPEDADEEERGFFVVRDGEMRRDDMRDLDIDALSIEKKEGAGAVRLKEEGAEDKVRILPIGPGPGGEGEALDPGMIFVGKDRVQVEQALGGVPLEPAAARHEEL